MNWRLLVLGAKVFINEKKEIYLVSAENKDDVELVKQLKRQGIVYSEFELPEGTKFRLKFINHENSLRIMAKTEKLGDSWLRVMNFYDLHFPSILEQNIIDHGEIQNEFELIFNKSNPTQISFISPEMSDYSECVDEMTRMINCSLYKKTKKIQAGHRYDSPTETRIYIGKVNSRKSCMDSSVFLDNTQVKDVWLYVNRLKPGIKTTDDIFKSCIFGTGICDIKVEFGTIPSMVDSGEVLEVNNDPDITTYWDDTLLRSIKACETVTKEGYLSYQYYEPVLDLFSYQTSNLGYDKFSSKSYLEIFIKDVMKHHLLIYWDKINYRADLIIGKNKTEEENIKTLVKLFYEGLGSENVMRHLYYFEILNKLGIDIENLATIVLKAWSINNELYADFDTYYKHLFYIKRNKLGEESIDFRVKGAKSLKDLYVDGYLIDMIIKLVDEAKSNYGIGINDYKINEDKSITCKITLEDIMHKEPSLSEGLKKEILKYKFYSICLTFDDTHKVA